MNKLVEFWGWLSSNKEWVFGGVGVVVVVGFGRVLLHMFRKKPAVQQQSQSGGAFSKNTQVMIKMDGDKE